MTSLCCANARARRNARNVRCPLSPLSPIPQKQLQRHAPQCAPPAAGRRQVPRPRTAHRCADVRWSQRCRYCVARPSWGPLRSDERACEARRSTVSAGEGSGRACARPPWRRSLARARCISATYVVVFTPPPARAGGVLINCESKGLQAHQVQPRVRWRSLERAHTHHLLMGDRRTRRAERAGRHRREHARIRLRRDHGDAARSGRGAA